LYRFHRKNHDSKKETEDAIKDQGNEQWIFWILVFLLVVIHVHPPAVHEYFGFGDDFQSFKIDSVSHKIFNKGQHQLQ
jgi:hypothetical protein